MPRTWIQCFTEHHEESVRMLDARRKLDPHGQDGIGSLMLAQSHATLAQAQALRAIARELRRIRLAIERPASLQLTASLVPKTHGGDTMPLELTPNETQNVQFSITPRNAAGNPTTGPFNWSVSDGAAGSLAPSEDGKTCLLVTNPGQWDVVVIVKDTRSGITETAHVFRTVAPPEDNSAVTLGLTGELVEKVATG
jgi:hypothetical protein